MARVIRGQGRVIPRAAAESYDEAARILAKAQRQAALMTRAAQEEADRLREQVREEARRDVEREVGRLVADAQSVRDRLLADATTELTKVAMAAARKLVVDEWAADPSRAQALVKDLISRLRRATVLTVYVHPDYVEVARTAVNRPGFGVEPDDRLGPGDCVVRSNHGDLDARLDVRLALLEEALKESVS